MLMKRLFGSIVAALASFAHPADAAMVSYFLNQTNIDPTLADGVNYARVDIDDDTPNRITFNVTLLGALTSLATTNFGIQEFAFNVLGANPLSDAPSGNGATSAYFGGSTMAALVPLPATLPLLFSGLAALSGLFRRRSGEVVMTVADAA